MLPAGTRVGDYEIEAELGAGGMATVYRARHALLESHYALKVLDPRYRASAEARARFLDEARIQHKHLDHPNIVKVVNVVATAEHAALVMELVDGPSLEDAQGELRARPDEVKRIMLAVLGAVGHAHAAGVVHRDLKPANVLLQRKGGRLDPKVTDFGIAKLSAAFAGPRKRSTQGDHRMGTLGYMSPEQIRRAKDVTARSDIFSLGVMLYELTTGALPFDGDNEYEVMDRVLHGRYVAPEERAPGIDPVIARVIRRALAVEPAERFASCEEMARALEGAGGAALPSEGEAVRDADAEWDAHEPTPVPAPRAIEVARPASPVMVPRSPVAPALAGGTRPIAGTFDVRSSSARSLERALLPIGVAIAALLLVIFVSILLGLAVAVAGYFVDRWWQSKRFHEASTILVRVEARAEQRAALAAAMRELGFEPCDESDQASLHPIERLSDSVEARTFQAVAANRAIIDALHERCARELADVAPLPAASREMMESAEPFAHFLALLLHDRDVAGAGPYCDVRVLHWQDAA